MDRDENGARGIFLRALLDGALILSGEIVEMPTTTVDMLRFIAGMLMWQTLTYKFIIIIIMLTIANSTKQAKQKLCNSNLSADETTTLISKSCINPAFDNKRIYTPIGKSEGYVLILQIECTIIWR